ncbi:DNA cross-link repair 1A protein [Hypsibius exemplaris]|uniref:DNA cross-link repair 1A protein n=1 Tax=Hypsibius exemplaris TaxID=2072580 RepID=A0A1W0XB84_HYPEX|nr:DNA cross-link repair 1A protein [Hypsibius exemplaris]
MDGPRLKRSRSEYLQPATENQKAAVIILEDDEEEEEVIILETKISSQRSISTPSDFSASKSTLRTRTALASLKQFKSNSVSVKLVAAVAKKKKMVQTTLIQRRKVKQPIKQSTVQSSLMDFFQPKIALNSSSALVKKEELRTPAYSADILKQKNDVSGSTKQWTEQHSSQSPELPMDLERSVELLVDDSLEINREEILSNSVEDDDGNVVANSEEDDDSSGDELLSSVADEVLLDDAPSPAIYARLLTPPSAIPHQRKPSSAGPFKNKSGRSCPFYKIMPGSPFSVDAFQFGYIPNVKSYFLSHFHSDHYIGLTSKFQQPIYCSRITANLVKAKIRVDGYWVKEIPMNTPYVVDNVELTLLDANHCPGSCLFLFKLRDGRVYLHTGDFRADPAVLGSDPVLKGLREVSKLYLDTTYLDPYYEFESQAATVEIAAEFALRAVQKNPRTLIVCGTYSVGKEKIFLRVAEVLKARVAVSTAKLALMKCFEWPEFESVLTKDWSTAQVHVLPMRDLNVQTLTTHLHKHGKFDAILAIVPSGWQFNKKNISLRDIKPRVSGAISILGLPYSEHSSFKELEWFVRFIKPKEVIPTVNVGNPQRRKEMDAILKSWLDPNYRPAVMKKQNLLTTFFQP